MHLTCNDKKSKNQKISVSVNVRVISYLKSVLDVLLVFSLDSLIDLTTLETLSKMTWKQKFIFFSSHFPKHQNVEIYPKCLKYHSKTES